jgi:hypothetical protein
MKLRTKTFNYDYYNMDVGVACWGRSGKRNLKKYLHKAIRLDAKNEIKEQYEEFRSFLSLEQILTLMCD